MGVNKRILAGVMLTIFIIMSGNNTFSEYSNHSIIDEILNNMELSIKEYKITGTFNTTESKEKVYDDLFETIEKIIGQVEESSKDEGNFKINYGEEKYYGEISINPYKDEYEVIISISIYGENLEQDKKNILETKIKNVLSILNSNVEYSLCVKSEIKNNTMDEVKDKVTKYLMSKDKKNIDEVKIYNGYSIIGYTDMYNRKSILGKDIYFNCAIVKYSSGCYLIMGEPEITITY